MTESSRWTGLPPEEPGEEEEAKPFANHILDFLRANSTGNDFADAFLFSMFCMTVGWILTPFLLISMIFEVANDARDRS